LSNNYEVIKEEVKQDLFQVLNSINELNSKVLNNKNESYDDRFNEINNQFDQFRFLLKEVTDNVIDKNNKQYEEVNSIIESLNSKFINLIEDLKDENIKSGQIIINKVSENTGKFKEEFDSSLEVLSNQLSNLASDIENKNKEFETVHVDAINFILETNRNNQREILGYIKNIEDNNERFLNEIEAKKYNIENSKLKNLEELIELQNNEIESLISEKNSFVIEVEKYISNKKDQLTNENILKLEDSIQDVVGVLNAKIEDLEVEFGRKLQELDLSSYFDYFDKTHNDFINSVQLQLSNNYEVIKNEIKNDIESVLDSVKDIPSRMDYSHKFDDRFNEIDSQFEQFRFILKNTTESILDKDSKTYKEVNDVINTLSNKFESLISDLKDENIKTVDLLNEKIATSQEEVNRKIDSSVDLIDDKFEIFLKEIKEQNKYFETTQFDTIQSIIETNKVNQKEILGYIRNLEQTNAEFLNEIEARRISKENLKLKELEELISLQNQEIEELLDEKEEFINEVETFMLNKKNKLDSENLIRLEDSIKITMANFSDKITDLERSFDKKIADIDLSSVSSLVSSEQANFFDSIQDSLTYNYELVRNEFKDNLNEVLNTITALNESNESKLGQIDNQLENFRSLLKDVTEGFLNKEEKHYLQIDDI
ncbi:MAG: hypothetical protein K2G48_02285, partial [Malacoplasma sp.]|nr:hypothetical protein [Malacoplasma sp.]